MGNLCETSYALRKFCLKVSNGVLCRAPMKKAHVGVFCFRAATRRAGHTSLHMRMRLMGGGFFLFGRKVGRRSRNGLGYGSKHYIILPNLHGSSALYW